MRRARPLAAGRYPRIPTKLDRMRRAQGLPLHRSDAGRLTTNIDMGKGRLSASGPPMTCAGRALVCALTRRHRGDDAFALGLSASASPSRRSFATLRHLLHGFELGVAFDQ